MPVDSYFASVIADFIRQRLLEAKQSFTFESVMSHPSKIEFMRMAQAQGYRTYLYFVSTENPRINIERVAIRVRAGGHPVRDDLVRSRYERSLDLLPEAMPPAIVPMCSTTPGRARCGWRKSPMACNWSTAMKIYPTGSSRPTWMKWSNRRTYSDVGGQGGLFRRAVR